MARDFDVLAMGRSSLDLYAHEIGVPITGVRSFDAYVGGCPTNVAVGTRRLGLRSALLTAVGDDQVGEFICDFLRREGVDIESTARKPGRRSSAVILTILPPDRFPLTFYRDNCADRELTIDDASRAPIASSRLLFLTGTGLSHEPARSATFFAAEQAAAAGAEVLVDLDYRPDQWSDPQAFGLAIRSLLGVADLAVGTEAEVRAAAGTESLAAAIARLLACGVRALVLKRGGRGSTICRPGAAAIDAPPFPVDVLNVLGAGDGFASGFIYGHLRGWTLEDAARMGNATGAIVVTRHGCANFMPTMDDVESFLFAQGGWRCPPQSV